MNKKESLDHRDSVEQPDLQCQYPPGLIAKEQASVMPVPAQYTHGHHPYGMMKPLERVDQETPAGNLHSIFFGQLLQN